MHYGLNNAALYGQIPDPVVIVPPGENPVSLAEIRNHLRIDDDLTDDDDQLDALSMAATQYVERLCGLALIDQTLEMRLDGYPRNGVISLRGPLISVISFAYTAANGVVTALGTDQYLVEAALKNVAPRIVQPFGVTWPYAIPASDAVRIQWRAGFADRTGSPTESLDLIPGPLKIAIKFHVEAHYERDERTFKMLMDAVDNLCAPYRVSFGVA